MSQPAHVRLLHFALRHWRMASLQLTLAVMGTMLMPIFPGVTQWFFDDIIPNHRSDLIFKASMVMLGGFAGQELLFYFRTRVNSAFEQRMVFDLRGQLHRKIARMRMAWFDAQSTGDVLTRMADDVPATQRVILEGIEQGVTAVLQMVMAAAVMFHTNAALTWIVLIPTPFLAAGGWIYARLLSPRATQARVATSAMNAMLFDTIAGIRQIKSYTFEDRQQEHFNASSRNLQTVQKKLMAAAALYAPLMTIIGKLGLVLIMFVGANWCVNGYASGGTTIHLKQGELFAFVLLVGMLYEPIARLHGVNQTLVTGLASAKRVFAVLDETGEEDLESGNMLDQVRGEVVFDNISFAYIRGRPVISHINLRVEPHQTVAFVGATGSGKSTLFQLLTRFYDPESGHIRFDGRPLTDYSKASVRDAIALTQDAFLFATTVRDNLLLGKPDASEQELWEALQLACADEFVRHMDKGLDSEVGERGTRLSGGERQRLSMARAFLKNAPILLLDEATSAVDNKSEHLIQEALTKLRQNRTCLVIAHRLSTVVEADRIYVMRLGEIVASGTHAELLKSSPYYAELAALAFDTQRKAG